MTNLRELLAEASEDATVVPLFVHAHPDDETVQTGALMAWLAANNVEVQLLTCTRGEQGEIVAGVLPESTTPGELVRVREDELARAAQTLGITAAYVLGTPPARAVGHQRRDYHDSGMRWIAEGLAGPAEIDDPQTFTASSLDDEVADLLALIDLIRPSVLVGYDRLGSYGHPDHVRAHELADEAAQAAGLPLVEVASEPGADGFEWFDLSDQRSTVVAALRCHATQLSVVDGRIVHVGGQHQELPLSAGLRRIR